MATLPVNDESISMSRYKSPVIGRLIAMPTTPMNINQMAGQAGFKSTISFDFPAMPDSIELARSADYFVSFNPIMPDGIHQYRGTRPLEIPLSFKLHAMDPTFCKEFGALTLLQMAARLHSFVLPITSDGQIATAVPVTAGDIIDKDVPIAQRLTGAARETALKSLGAKTEAQVQYDSSLNSNVYKLNTGKGSSQGSGSYPPVTCFLNLIWVAEDQPGISCVGYVKDVRVRLMGPWLRGPNGAFNLPSWGEFEFTFVHRPAHRNDYGGALNTTSDFSSTPAAPEVHAFATDVRNRLFNTRNLVTMEAGGYHGFGGQASQPSTDAAILAPKSDSGGNDYSSAQSNVKYGDPPPLSSQVTPNPPNWIGPTQ